MFNFQVIGYEFLKNNVNIIVFDILGLVDVIGKDEEYVQKIQVMGIKFDLFFFCIEMNVIRFCNDDLEIMKKLIMILGWQLWDYVVVVLIFVNEVCLLVSQKVNSVLEKEVFSNCFVGFKKKIKEVLK